MINILTSDKERLRQIILSLPGRQIPSNPLSSEFDDRAVSNIPKSSINRNHKMIVVRNQSLLRSQQNKRVHLKSKIKDYVRQSIKQSQINSKVLHKISYSDLREAQNNHSSTKLVKKPSFNSLHAKSQFFRSSSRRQSQLSSLKVLNNLCLIGPCEISKESPKKSAIFRKRIYNSQKLARSGVQSSVLSERKQKVLFDDKKRSGQNNPQCRFQSIEPWKNQQDYLTELPFYIKNHHHQ